MPESKRPCAAPRRLSARQVAGTPLGLVTLLPLLAALGTACGGKTEATPPDHFQLDAAADLPSEAGVRSEGTDSSQLSTTTATTTSVSGLPTTTSVSGLPTTTALPPLTTSVPPATTSVPPITSTTAATSTTVASTTDTDDTTAISDTTEPWVVTTDPPTDVTAAETTRGSDIISSIEPTWSSETSEPVVSSPVSSTPQTDAPDLTTTHSESSTRVDGTPDLTDEVSTGQDVDTTVVQATSVDPQPSVPPAETSAPTDASTVGVDATGAPALSATLDLTAPAGIEDAGAGPDASLSDGG